MSNVTQVTDQTFEKEVLQSTQPVLVDFWAPWCGPCRMVGPIVEAIGEKHQAKLKVVKLNTDDNMDTAAHYNVSSIPTLILFQGGAEAHRMIGYQPQQAMEKELSPYIS